MYAKERLLYEDETEDYPYKVYLKTINSLIFPNFNLVETIPKLVKQAFDQGTSQMLREFRLSLITG